MGCCSYLADLGLFSCIFASKKFRLYPQIRAVTGRVALGVILHPILHFFQKGVILGQKRRFFYFLSYLHGLFHACAAFAYKHRSKSANEPASIGPKCHLAFNAANYSQSIWQQCHVGSNPTAYAKYHYSILHWVVIFCCRFVKFPYFSYKHLPFIFK